MHFGRLRKIHARCTLFALTLKIGTFSALTLKYFALTYPENGRFKLSSRTRLRWNLHMERRAEHLLLMCFHQDWASSIELSHLHPTVRKTLPGLLLRSSNTIRTKRWKEFAWVGFTGQSVLWPDLRNVALLVLCWQWRDRLVTLPLITG